MGEEQSPFPFNLILILWPGEKVEAKEVCQTMKKTMCPTFSGWLYTFLNQLPEEIPFFFFDTFILIQYTMHNLSIVKNSCLSESQFENWLPCYYFSCANEMKGYRRGLCANCTWVYAATLTFILFLLRKQPTVTACFSLLPLYFFFTTWLNYFLAADDPALH